MSATKKPSEVRELIPKEEAEKFFSAPQRWNLSVEGVPQPLGCDWEVRSPFGSAGPRIVMGPDGKPVFDRVGIREAPNVNVVVYGIDENGKARFAVIRQPRPHSDLPEPENRGKDGHQPVVFGQIVMGFLEKLIGKDLIAKYESVQQGAVREASEEGGVSVVLDIEYPKCPWHNPNPTFVETWSDVPFVKVDLSAIQKLKADRNEPIFSAEYVTFSELRRRVAEGKDETGALYRMCTANSAWFIFFCCHPEFFKDDYNVTIHKL